MVKLVFLSGPLAGHRYATNEDVRIGRDPSNDIVIPDDSVSLVHCQLVFGSGRMSVKDLGSTNGIQVNGTRVVSRELRHDDRLSVGKNRIRVECVSASEEGTAPPAPQAGPVAGEAKVADAEGPLSGNIFGSVTYYLKRIIASGGMGAVYEAEQFGAEGFIKTVAIKTILPSFSGKRRFVSSFVGEAKLVANLVHPNIVQIYHLGRHDKGYYIAMEYIDGLDLGRFIRIHSEQDLSMPVDLALFVLSRVGFGLEYAHGKTDAGGNELNLVHRDVSPSNIMVSRAGEVKLTDFGVAKAAQFMEEDGEYLVGCVEYMSPEQARGGVVDLRSDLFSLGLVGYELLTGVRVLARRSGEDDDLQGLADRLAEARIPDPREYRSTLPEPVAAMLNKCLRKEPAERYASASELTSDIEANLHALGRMPTGASLAGYVASLGSAPRGAGKERR